MPPIVSLMVGALPTSKLPVLAKSPLVMLYETEFSVTPGTASRLNPREPTCSVPELSACSLVQPASGAPGPRASKRMSESAPGVATSLGLPCQYFMDFEPFQGSRPERPAFWRPLERLATA